MTLSDTVILLKLKKLKSMSPSLTTGLHAPADLIRLGQVKGDKNSKDSFTNHFC